MPNYVLSENADLGLLNITGQQTHQALTYVRSNHQKLDNSIRMFIATFNDEQTESILSIDGWDKNEKEIIITNTPEDLDYNNGDGINIIISPTEDLGKDNNDELSEETSSEIYSEYGIRCTKYDYDLETKKLKLKFKRDDAFDYNINVKVLVLYNSTNIYNMPE